MADSSNAAPGEEGGPHQLKAEQDSAKTAPYVRSVTWKGVMLYGICILVGNQFTYWSRGLTGGFWAYFGSVVTIMIAFGCVSLCLAEMTAALPFSGGTYGVVRVAIGDWLSYLVGTTEAFKNLLYVAFNIVAIGNYITDMTGFAEFCEPFYWLAIYATILIIMAFYIRAYWMSITICTMYICATILLYCILPARELNFDKYAHDRSVDELSASETALRFFQSLPAASWMFGLAAKVMPLT